MRFATPCGLALGLAALALGLAGAGIFAWWRRPASRVGPLMTLDGFLWSVGALASADGAWAYVLGVVLGALWLGAG